MKNALIITGHDGVTITTREDVVTFKNNLLEEFRGIESVGDAFTHGLAVDAIRKGKGLIADVEASRQAIKAPVLELGRKIDGLAAAFVADITAEVKRLNTASDRYVSEERRLAMEAEFKRQAELRRVEAERHKAEQDRIAAEKAALQAQHDAATSFSPEQEAQAKRDAELAQMARLEADRLAQEAEARRRQLQAPVVVAKPAGVTVKDVWKHEVLDLHALYAANPALVRMEPNVAAINEAIRLGAREIPGLRIWSEVNQQVRR